MSAATGERSRLDYAGTEPGRVTHMFAASATDGSDLTCCGLTTVTMPGNEYITRTPRMVTCDGCRERIHLGDAA